MHFDQECDLARLVSAWLRCILRFHGDGSTARSELHSVLHQVPEHLLEPRWVGAHIVVGGLETCDKLQTGSAEIAFAGLKSSSDERMNVYCLTMQCEFAAHDARDVEQIVDEAR